MSFNIKFSSNSNFGLVLINYFKIFIFYLEYLTTFYIIMLISHISSQINFINYNSRSKLKSMIIFVSINYLNMFKIYFEK